MATPHVAGILAMLRSKDSTLSPEAAKCVILNNALENIINDVKNSSNLLLHVDCV